MPELRKEIGELWRDVNREVHERFRQAFRQSEMPVIALVLLRTIGHHPGVTIGELARRSGTVKSHVSKTVERLERQGFVEKRQDPEDQRLVRLFLTHLADELTAEMESRAMVVWSGITDAVPEGQLHDVMRGLRILRDALESSKEKVDM